MSGAEVKNLRSAAEQAFAAGRYQQALAHSIRLERAEPGEPAWPRYTALICQAMGRTLDQVDALGRAADRHSEKGETLKAAAACKHILAIDPEHEPTRQRLISLRADHEKRHPRTTPAPRRPAIERVPSAVWNQDNGSGLQSVPLRSIVPGARRSEHAGVYSIPLEETPERSLSLELEPDVRRGEAQDGSGVLPSGVQVEQVVGRPATWGDRRDDIDGGLNIEVTAEDAAVMAVAAELQAAQRTEQALIETPLFRDMPEDAFYELIDRAKLITLKKEQSVFRQGAPGDSLYVISSGEIGVIDEGPPRRGICKLGDGDFFGEMALLSDAPRSATCTSLTDVELISIDRDTILSVLKAHPEVLTVVLRFFRDRSVDRVLQVSPFFSGLSSKDKNKIRPYFRFLEAEAGASLIREGSRPEGLVMLVAGKGEAVKIDPASGQEHRLGVLLAGEMAGELSLLTGDPATATVRAIDKIFALEFPAAAFRKILKARPAVGEYVRRVAQNRQAKLRRTGRY